MVVIFCILIVGGCAFIGFQIMNFYVRRDKFFKDAVSFCEIVLNETNFNKTPLTKLIADSKKLFHNDFSKSIDAFVCSLNLGQDYNEKNSLLKDEEKTIFESFFNNLGKSNLENHNNIVHSFMEKIKLKVEKEMCEEKKRGSAIFKVSFCVGLMIAILLV